MKPRLRPLPRAAEEELSDTVFDKDRAELRLLAAIRKARQEGLTWQRIGTVLGVTRAAAFDRYKRLSKKWEAKP